MSDVYKIIKLLKEVVFVKRLSISPKHDIESWNHGYKAGYNDAICYVLEYVYDELGYDDNDLEDE